MARKKIYRAGVIPYIEVDGEIQMMFMKPANSKYGGKSYQISKGKVEEGEKIEEAAKREAKEELGLFSGNVLDFTSLGEWLGRTTFYIAHIKDKTMFGDPHFETGSTTWLTLEAFLKDGRDLHKPVVKAAHRKMKKKLDK